MTDEEKKTETEKQKLRNERYIDRAINIGILICAGLNLAIQIVFLVRS